MRLRIAVSSWIAEERDVWRMLFRDDKRQADVRELYQSLSGVLIKGLTSWFDARRVAQVTGSGSTPEGPT
jgi:hypothetical protein